MTAFAVFLLSLFVRTRRKAVLSVGCRSPPFNLEISQNFQIGGTQYGLQQSQGKKILVKGLKGKKGSYDAYLIPERVEEFSYTKDGKEIIGSQYKFKMEFPQKKDK